MIKEIPMNIKVAIGSLLLKLFYSTNQKDVRGRHNYLHTIQNRKSVILSVWHSQLLSIVHDLRDEIVHAIAGTHMDAEIISRIATKWGWKMMRGSSKEKGDLAYRAMIRTLKIPGSIIFITPDGPTGPPKIPKPGVIRAAQATGAAIIPIHVRSTRHWEFTNWDTFYLEKPFGKIFINYGKPFYFEQKSDLDLCTKTLIQKMSETETSNLQYTNNESL